MSTKPLMEFKRGMGTTAYFALPVSGYVAGSLLWFTAKPEIDNDVTDSKAVINKQFTDANIVGPMNSQYDPAYVTWELDFVPADITGVSFDDGNQELDYLGEFKYLVSGFPPALFPPDRQYIQVKIYGNVRLKS